MPPAGSTNSASLTSARGEPEAVRLASGAHLRVGADEQPYDYVLLPYPPVTPTEGKLASVNVLRESFAMMGVEEEGMRIVDGVIQWLGSGRTVWGIKYRGPDEPMSWEFYFYHRDRPGRELTLDGVLDSVAPHLEFSAELDRPVDWLMFSFEFGPEELKTRTVPHVSLYVRDSNLSYDLIGSDLVATNLYLFYDTSTDTIPLLQRIHSLVHFTGEGNQLGVLMPPVYYRCRTVCVANKRQYDALYFSRTSQRGLHRFLEAFEWPEHLRRYMESNREGFDHLLWDIGYDFRLSGGDIQWGKSGFYGYF